MRHSVGIARATGDECVLCWGPGMEEVSCPGDRRNVLLRTENGRPTLLGAVFLVHWTLRPLPVHWTARVAEILIWQEMNS